MPPLASALPPAANGAPDQTVGGSDIPPSPVGHDTMQTQHPKRGPLYSGILGGDLARGHMHDANFAHVAVRDGCSWQAALF
jgi:hypothetical protein